MYFGILIYPNTWFALKTKISRTAAAAAASTSRKSYILRRWTPSRPIRPFFLFYCLQTFWRHSLIFCFSYSVFHNGSSPSLLLPLPSVCLSFRLIVCLSFCPTVCCLSVCLASVYLPVYLSVCLYVYLSVCLSSVYLSFRLLSISPFLFLPGWGRSRFSLRAFLGFSILISEPSKFRLFQFPPGSRHYEKPNID